MTHMITDKRKSGILVHPTCFPSPFGIGNLGDEARTVLKKFADIGVKIWQILPLGPTGYGDSPYSALSTFAGNEYLIDPRRIAELKNNPEVMYEPQSSARVDYAYVSSKKMALLKKGAELWLKNHPVHPEFDKFCKEEKFWLDDYALYRVLCNKFNDTRWFIWPEELKLRKPDAIKKYTKENEDEILIWKVLQYFFEIQWNDLKDYVHSLGMEIIGDIPIYVGADSVDSWTHPEILKMDENRNQTAQAGCPPDDFSSTGQLWGNPVYDWDKNEESNFKWWLKRIEKNVSRVDTVRIDHFRGLSTYWEVPAGESTAQNGKWMPGPGMKLINKLKKFSIFAEDLGTFTPDVYKLLDDSGLPRMRVIQFAFGFKDGHFDNTNFYLPHNYMENCVCYTGTHDNNTTRGWYNSLDEGTKDIVRRYLQCPDEEVVWQSIRAVLASHSATAVIPLQDVLEKDESGRMNAPSTVGTHNWSWRFAIEELDQWRLDRLRDFILMYR